MLQTFNKLALYLASAITITNAHSSEYIVTNANDTSKEQIYYIVSKYRFPSILSQFTQEEFKDKYPKLDLIDTFKTKESEHQFIQNEIKKIEPNAKVYAIPKSLYQFMVYDYFAETIAYPKDNSVGTLFSQCVDYQRKFDLCKYANENEEWSLTKACNNFMQNKDIRDIFWKVNDYAKDLYKLRLENRNNS